MRSGSKQGIRLGDLIGGLDYGRPQGLPESIDVRVWRFDRRFRRPAWVPSEGLAALAEAFGSEESVMEFIREVFPKCHISLDAPEPRRWVITIALGEGSPTWARFMGEIYRIQAKSGRAWDQLTFRRFNQEAGV